MFRRLDILVTPGVDQPGGILTIGGDATSIVLGTPVTMEGMLAVAGNMTVGGTLDVAGTVEAADFQGPAAGRLIVNNALRVNTTGGASNGYLSFGESGGNGRTIAARLTAGDALSNVDFVSQTFHSNGIILPATARIDANVAGALNIGTSTQNQLNLGRTTINTDVLGPLRVEGSIDRIAAGTLSIGASTQNQLNLGRATINTDMLGLPRIDGTVSAALSPLKTVAAIYTRSTAQTITNAAFNIVDFTTSVLDTDSAVTTGASWHFTCPSGKGGLYHVAAVVSIEFPVSTAVPVFLIGIWKNGVEQARGTRYALTTPAGGGTMSAVAVSDVVLAATDTVDIRVYQDSGASRSIEAFASNNRVAIHRIPGS